LKELLIFHKIMSIILTIFLSTAGFWFGSILFLSLEAMLGLLLPGWCEAHVLTSP